jgi:hypothetical protein
MQNHMLLPMTRQYARMSQRGLGTFWDQVLHLARLLLQAELQPNASDSEITERMKELAEVLLREYGTADPANPLTAEQVMERLSAPEAEETA